MELHRVDLNLLVVLDALLEEGTLTNVATRLHLSQPTVSASLAKLRELFGDELFVRSGGRMSPTALALQLKEPIQRILRVVQHDILSSAAFDPLIYRGTLTISLSDIGELEFLPELMKRVSASAPEAIVRAVMLNPTTLSEAMDRGEVDLAIGYLPDLQTSVFQQQVLFNHGSSCIVRRDHPILARGMTRRQFEEAGHIVVVQETRRHDPVEEAIAEHGVRRKAALTVSHFVNVPFLVSKSDLVATLPIPLTRSFETLYPLVALPPPFPIRKLEIKQVWHRRFHNSARVAWLRNLVANMSQNKPSL